MIGEYQSKIWIVSDFDDIFHGTRKFHVLNQSAMDNELSITLKTRDAMRFDASLFDGDDPKKPQSKRIKVEQDDEVAVLSKGFDFVLDPLGLPKARQTKLRFINDCRVDINVSSMTERDRLHCNVQFVRSMYFEQPKVYVVSTRKIEENEELMAYFGENYGTTVTEIRRFDAIQRRKMMDVDRILTEHDIHDINTNHL